MNNPVFSVCVPVYKAEKFLDACINSVLTQTFTDFEIILVDDGSPDNSGAMCDDYASKDPRIIAIHKENGGQLSARVAAVDKAHGDYIVFLDSDDTLEPNALEAIKNAFNQFNVDLVIYDMQRVINGVAKPPKKLYETMILQSKREIFKFILASTKYNSLCIKCFKKSTFSSIDYSKYFSIRHAEDLIQSIDLMSGCDSAVVIPDILYNYTFNEDSVSNATNWMLSSPDYTVRSYVLNKLLALNIFNASDMAEYQEYCISQLLSTISAIATSNIPQKEKLSLFNEIRNNDYYESFLRTPLGKLKGLGFKKYAYSLFTSKSDTLLIFILKIVNWLKRKFKHR